MKDFSKKAEFIVSLSSIVNLGKNSPLLKSGGAGGGSHNVFKLK